MATPEEQAALDKKAAAQVEADQRVAAEALSKVEVVVSGDAVLGGPFNIYGDHFGPRGTLRIGDREITIGRWDDNVIGGSLLPGTKGAVVLTTSKGVRHGTFPHVPKVVTETTTVTVKTT